MQTKLGQLDNDAKEVKETIEDLKKIEPPKPVEVAPEPKSKTNERVLLKSLNSQSNIELDESVQNRLKQISDEMKEQHHISIENEEQIQLINKRLSTLEGGSAGVLGFLERVDEVKLSSFFLVIFFYIERFFYDLNSTAYRL